MYLDSVPMRSRCRTGYVEMKKSFGNWEKLIEQAKILELKKQK